MLPVELIFAYFTVNMKFHSVAEALASQNKGQEILLLPVLVPQMAAILSRFWHADNLLFISYCAGVTLDSAKHLRMLLQHKG